MNDYERKNRLEEALEIRKMKQSDLCRMTGLGNTSVNGWIKNNWQPKKDALYRMARVLDVSEMWLAGYDVPMERPKDIPRFTKAGDHSKEAKRIEYLNRISRLPEEQQNLIFNLVDQLEGR